VYYPDAVIDRSSQGDWEAAGGASAADRAHDKVRRILDAPEVSRLESQKLKELERLMAADAADAGMERLPDWRLF
jgi:trimethylamine:corrinoid methyltransferase-like protein